MAEEIKTKWRTMQYWAGVFYDLLCERVSVLRDGVQVTVNNKKVSAKNPVPAPEWGSYLNVGEYLRHLLYNYTWDRVCLCYFPPDDFFTPDSVNLYSLQPNTMQDTDEYKSVAELISSSYALRNFHALTPESLAQVIALLNKCTMLNGFYAADRMMLKYSRWEIEYYFDGDLLKKEETLGNAYDTSDSESSAVSIGVTTGSYGAYPDGTYSQENNVIWMPPGNSTVFDGKHPKCKFAVCCNYPNSEYPGAPFDFGTGMSPGDFKTLELEGGSTEDFYLFYPAPDNYFVPAEHTYYTASWNYTGGFDFSELFTRINPE